MNIHTPVAPGSTLPRTVVLAAPAASVTSALTANLDRPHRTVSTRAGHLDQPDVVMGEWDCRRNIDVGDHFVRSRSADDREDLPYPVGPVKVLVLKSHRRNLWANDINVSAPAVPAPIVNSAAGVAITIAAAAITKLVSWRIVSRPICFLLPTTGPNRIMDSWAPRRCATAALHARQNIAAHPVDPTGRAHVDLMDLTVLTTV